VKRLSASTGLPHRSVRSPSRGSMAELRRGPGPPRRVWMYAVLLVGAGIAVFAGIRGSRSVLELTVADPGRAELAAPASPPAREPYYTTVSDTIRRGDTLSGILLRNHVAVQEIARIQQRIRELGLFSPRKLKPGRVVSLSRDEYGTFRRLRYEASPEEIYLFEDTGDSLLARMEAVEKRTRLRKLEGRVDPGSSFDEAIRKCGGDYRLTLKVSDIFAYDVDFFTDVRQGDRFQLLVEERFVNGRFVGYGDVLYANYEGERAQCEAIHYSWGDGTGGYYDAQGHALKKAFLRSPLNYRRISSTFGNRMHPILKRMRHHDGIDYAAGAGTPVVALGDGVVDYKGWKGGYGNALRIRHKRSLQTLYGHLKRFARGIKKGTRVEQGQVIGYVGQTGLATGPHLHFEVIENGRAINPLRLRNEPAKPIPAPEHESFLLWAGQVRDLNSYLVTGQVLDPFRPDELPQALAQAGPIDPPAFR
jgi:murein DD-endopeptidase MepM/ murein hydrolase activator NlpD